MNEKRIDEVFNILIQFEKIQDNTSNVTEDSYKNYLDKLYVQYLGFENKEIANYLKGLYILGENAKHDTVKRSVFHVISLLNKELR